jgi:Domain of unknown function (DUF4062)
MMIPHVFVSSTIQDLQYLRDGVRSLVKELGYNPIMSEYGEVGYPPWTSAIQSCLNSVTQCQLAIVIIGKRYGYKFEDGRSVTHHEFLEARTKKIPILFLVEEEVLKFKKVYDSNISPKHDSKKKRSQKTGISFPGMEEPEMTFAFLSEIMESPVNNGVLPFTNVDSARSALKNQLADMFVQLLREKFDPIKDEVKDILSEIKALRMELTKGQADPEVVARLQRCTRYLIAEHSKDLRKITEFVAGSFDRAVLGLVNLDTLEQFLQKHGTKQRIVSAAEIEKTEDSITNHEPMSFAGSQSGNTRKALIVVFSAMGVVPEDVTHGRYPHRKYYWRLFIDKTLVMNEVAKEMFDTKFETLKLFIQHENLFAR